jgi:hypothetical protein
MRHIPSKGTPEVRLRLRRVANDHATIGLEAEPRQSALDKATCSSAWCIPGHSCHFMAPKECKVHAKSATCHPTPILVAFGIEPCMANAASPLAHCASHLGWQWRAAGQLEVHKRWCQEPRVVHLGLTRIVQGLIGQGRSRRVADSTRAAKYQDQRQENRGKEQDRSVQDICYLPRQGRA